MINKNILYLLIIMINYAFSMDIPQVIRLDISRHDTMIQSIESTDPPEGHVSLVVHFKAKTNSKEESFTGLWNNIYNSVFNLDYSPPSITKAGSAYWDYHTNVLVTSAHTLINVSDDDQYEETCAAIHVYGRDDLVYHVNSYVVHPKYLHYSLLNSTERDKYDIALLYLDYVKIESPQSNINWSVGNLGPSVTANLYGYTIHYKAENEFERKLHPIINVDFARNHYALSLEGVSTFFGMSGSNAICNDNTIIGIHNKGNCGEFDSDEHKKHERAHTQKAESLYIDSLLQTQLKQWYHVLYKNNLLHQVDLPRLSCDHIEEHRPVLFVIQADLDYDLQLHFLRILKEKLLNHNNKLQDICDFLF